MNYGKIQKTMRERKIVKVWIAALRRKEKETLRSDLGKLHLI